MFYIDVQTSCICDSPFYLHMMVGHWIDVSLGFPNIEAIATISFTCNFVHCASGLARVTIAAVSAYPIHFVIPWAVARAATNVGICDAPQ